MQADGAYRDEPASEPQPQGLTLIPKLNTHVAVSLTKLRAELHSHRRLPIRLLVAQCSGVWQVIVASDEREAVAWIDDRYRTLALALPERVCRVVPLLVVHARSVDIPSCLNIGGSREQSAEEVKMAGHGRGRESGSAREGSKEKSGLC